MHHGAVDPHGEVSAKPLYRGVCHGALRTGGDHQRRLSAETVDFGGYFGNLSGTEYDARREGLIDKIQHGGESYSRAGCETRHVTATVCAPAP